MHVSRRTRGTIRRGASVGTRSTARSTDRPLIMGPGHSPGRRCTQIVNFDQPIDGASRPRAADARSMTASARARIRLRQRSNPCSECQVDCVRRFAPRKDADTASRSRRAIRPRFCLNSRPLQSEGAGNAGRPMRPRSRVQDVVVKRTRAYRSHRNHPAFPAQWFYGYIALSPVTGLFGHRRLRELPFTNLTPASGRQDHTTSPSASTPFVNGAIRVHRIPPHVRDDRETPLLWDGTAGVVRVIRASAKRKYLRKRTWTG